MLGCGVHAVSTQSATASKSTFPAGGHRWASARSNVCDTKSCSLWRMVLASLGVVSTTLALSVLC